MKIVAQKPESLTGAKYHYCPGCTHGIIHRLIAEVMCELDILDETIGRAINVSDTQTWGVTVEFTVKFRKPVPLDGEVKAVGRIIRDSSRMFEGTGEIILEDGTVAAEGRGRYMKLPLQDIAAVEFSESEWFADGLPMPTGIDL